MTITFSDTFDKVEDCFKEPDIESTLTANLESVTIIRDVYGKIRLFLEPKANFHPEKTDIKKLEQYLEQKLGSYYGKDIWLPEGEKDGYKALIAEIKYCRINAEWQDNNIVPSLYILERHIAKQAWTNKNSGEPPWKIELVDQGHKPAIITFFSFKGGVGRTTALVATALTLARNGHRVAIVDLDLEAPGLSTIFFKDNSVDFGVIDYLLEKKIQKNNWSLNTHIAQINKQLLLGDFGESIRLIPAGIVDDNYLEKLARLDFQNLIDHELPDNFQDMLNELERLAKPLDFILLDSRAGFHDIGGLALTNLSHAAVIFGRQSRQSWDGLTHVIHHLSRPIAPEKRLPVCLVHAMAPSLNDPRRNEEVRAFREQAYQIFQEKYYDNAEDVPNFNDTEAFFTPIVIPLQNDLQGDISLFTRDDTEEEELRLQGIVNLMTSQDYQNLAERICRLFGKELDNRN
ncbi:tyrosine-protein kinase family protein [Anabaena sp. WFMT]|uniref:tyrosine-protein kinase family protein n=1 Tax=Anabaena sp. WFMT TaxID=3449730 RepID=UPI003F2826DE